VFPVELLKHELRRELEQLLPHCRPGTRLYRTPEHDEVLRIFKEVAKTTFFGLGEEDLHCIRTNALRGEHRSLFRPRQTLKMKYAGFAQQVEEGAERSKITLAKPVGRPARNPNFRRIDGKKFYHKFVDRIAIAAAGALLIEAVDEKRLPLQHRSRRVEKRARLDKPRRFGGGRLLEEMRLPCAGIAQQHNICLTDKVRERTRTSVLWPVRRDVCSANDSSHLDRLVIPESSKLPVIANLCQARQAVRTKVSAASAGRSISDDQRFKLGKGGFLTEPDRGTSRRRTEARCRRPIPGSPAELYTSPVSLFWLNYRHSDGRFAGVVVIESGDLIHARLKSALAGLDDGLEFVSGDQQHQADPP
jgi:hypothetical protein